jgi:hypothetical protein
VYISPGVKTYTHLKISHREKKSAEKNSIKDFQSSVVRYQLHITAHKKYKKAPFFYEE